MTDQIIQRREEKFMQTVADLRRMFLENVSRPLTVPEARSLNVCRVCRGSSTHGVFVFNFGEEFAHQSCIDGPAGEGI